MQKLSWNGIPHNYRSSAWKIMLASCPELHNRNHHLVDTWAGLYAFAGAEARGAGALFLLGASWLNVRQVVLSRLRKEYADQIASVFEGPRGDYEEKQALAHPASLRTSFNSSGAACSIMNRNAFAPRRNGKLWSTCRAPTQASSCSRTSGCSCVCTACSTYGLLDIQAQAMCR